MATSMIREPRCRGSQEQIDSPTLLDYRGEGCSVRGGVWRTVGPRMAFIH
jgi:hypothetical protein